MTQASHHDAGKAPVAELPTMPLEEVAKVVGYGAEKYGMNNWRKGMPWMKLLNSTLRHIYAFIRGENLDAESGLPHLAHACTNLLFLIQYMQDHQKLDDRYPSPHTNTMTDQ